MIADTLQVLGLLALLVVIVVASIVVAAVAAPFAVAAWCWSACRR